MEKACNVKQARRLSINKQLNIVSKNFQIQKRVLEIEKDHNHPSIQPIEAHY